HHPPPRRCQHRSPVRARRVLVRPDAHAGIDVPRLYFAADVRRARRHEGAGAYAARAGKRFAAAVLDRHADQRAAQIVVRRDVDHPRLRVERDWWPVLPTVRAWTEFCFFVGAWLVNGVDLGFPRHWIEALEDVLRDVRFAFDELDRAR